MDDSPRNPDAAPTTVSCLTPAGRGAVATLAIHGPRAFEIVARYFTPAGPPASKEFPLQRIRFGRWEHGEGIVEELVVSRTGPACLELHCHGGTAASQSILQACCEAGAVPLPWAAQLRRVSAPLQVAAAESLALARTERTAAILLDQWRGALARELDQLLLLLRAGDGPRARDRLAALLQFAPLGLHLTTPWRVVLAGPPNVGKSSLLNRLLGYSRSLVDAVAGTTRDVVTAESVLDGWLVEFCDTAGLRVGADPLEAAGVLRAESQLRSADLVLWVAEASASDLGHLAPPHVPHLPVANKCDLLAGDSGPPRPRPAPGGAWWYVSARTGEGIPELMEAIVQRLVPVSPATETPVPFTPGVVAALQAAGAALQAENPAEAIQLLERAAQQP